MGFAIKLSDHGGIHFVVHQIAKTPIGKYLFILEQLPYHTFH